jgi:hypothetical protein
MIFGKLLSSVQLNGGALKAPLNKTAATKENVLASEAGHSPAVLEITNVWSGPIIILSDESQMELEKHYLAYNPTISAESFEAIFRGQRLDEM